jgi:hypothetical protein
VRFARQSVASHGYFQVRSEYLSYESDCSHRYKVAKWARFATMIQMIETRRSSAHIICGRYVYSIEVVGYSVRSGIPAAHEVRQRCTVIGSQMAA